MTDAYTIWDIISDTPWWVLLIFIYLMRVGYLATKPRTLHINDLIIMPVLFVALSSIGMIATMHFSLHNLSLWTSTFLLGCLLGWLQFRILKITALKNEKKLRVPGTWSVFVLILAAFILKFYFNYDVTLNADLVFKGKYTVQLLLLYGLITGLFIGRLVYSYRCIKGGPFAAAI